jgi:hypothetical protein
VRARDARGLDVDQDPAQLPRLALADEDLRRAVGQEAEVSAPQASRSDARKALLTTSSNIARSRPVRLALIAAIARRSMVGSAVVMVPRCRGTCPGWDAPISGGAWNGNGFWHPV